MQTKRVKNKCSKRVNYVDLYTYVELFLSLFGKRAKASVEGRIWKAAYPHN